MDWAALLGEAGKWFASGGVSATIATLVTNGINHRATAKQAKLDRDAKAITSSRDRTYADAKTALMDSLALLIRVEQAIHLGTDEDLAETYQISETVSTLEANLTVFVSSEASELFRSATSKYVRSWQLRRFVDDSVERERVFYEEHEGSFDSRPVLQTTLDNMRDQRHEAATDSREAYREAERNQQRLREIATERLSGHSEGRRRPPAA